MEGKISGDLVFGLMSGTSGDGLDIAACRFSSADGLGDQYALIKAETFSFPETLKSMLNQAPAASGRDLRALDITFAKFMADCIVEFSARTGLNPVLLSSHGHTVFHQPLSGYTLQIGCGATLASLTGIETVCEFRQGDVSLGGQGAPLVPTGDVLLFGQWDYCLNLGGFANITLNRAEPLKAFDICAVNLVLNHLARLEGKDFDAGGELASRGNLCSDLLDAFNEVGYYQLAPPKSLGTEWLEEQIMPLISSYLEKYSPVDILFTYAEHIAQQIAKYAVGSNKRMLVTGGGAWNAHLISRLRYYCSCEINVPDKELVNFKEAIIFAYLGWLRKHNRINVKSSVTGSGRDSVSGAIYKG